MHITQILSVQLLEEIAKSGCLREEDGGGSGPGTPAFGEEVSVLFDFVGHMHVLL